MGLIIQVHDDYNEEVLLEHSYKALKDANSIKVLTILTWLSIKVKIVFCIPTSNFQMSI